MRLEIERLRADVAEIGKLRERVAELEGRLERRDVGTEGPLEAPLLSRVVLSRVGIDASLYGFVTAESFRESRRTGDRFLNILPPSTRGGRDGDFSFSVNATRLGLRVASKEPDPWLGLRAQGLLEVDFDTGDGGPRIRHAYAEILHLGVETLFGQTWAVVGQLNPETVNSDNLFNLGNVYERVPQVRVAKNFDLGRGRLRTEAGVLQFFGGFDQGDVSGVPLSLQQSAGSTYGIVSSALPLGQARVAWWPTGEDGYGAISFSGGRFKVEDSTGRKQALSHLLVAAEFALPVWGPLQLSAEAFWGLAPGFNGGVGQSVAIEPDGNARSVRSRGGFAQLAYRATDSVRCHLIYGIDDPDHMGGVDLAISRNQTLLTNCFWSLTSYLDVALEIQGVRTEWEAPAQTDTDDLRATPALYVRF